MPFQKLISNLSDKGVMTGYYEDNHLIGMSYVYPVGKIVYLAYLAIVPEERGHGYGAEILSRLRSRFSDCRIVCDIERVVPERTDQQEKVRRRRFYLSNGYASCNIYFRFFFVDYELLSCGGTVTKEEWIDLASVVWGRFFAKTIRFN